MRQAFLIVALLATSVRAEEIPLSSIWAYSMPGSKDVVELEPARLSNSPKDLLSVKIKNSLSPPNKPGDAFIVRGANYNALQEAFDILVDKQKPGTEFKTGEKLTLVFYSFSWGGYVHIHDVERTKNVIKIRYQVKPHTTKETTSHFALIPLEKLTAGKYQVETENIPLGKEFDGWPVKPLTKKELDEYVCKGFSFSVSE